MVSEGKRGFLCQGSIARVVEALQQANGRFRPQVYCGPLSRRLVAHIASATETNASKPAMAIFSDGVVLMAMVLMATAGSSPALTIGFRLGCSVMNSAIGGLTL